MRTLVTPISKRLGIERVHVTLGRQVFIVRRVQATGEIRDMTVFAARPSPRTGTTHGFVAVPAGPLFERVVAAIKESGK